MGGRVAKSSFEVLSNLSRAELAGRGSSMGIWCHNLNATIVFRGLIFVVWKPVVIVEISKSHLEAGIPKVGLQDFQTWFLPEGCS